MNDQNHAANHDEDKIKRPGIAPVGTMKAARVVPVGPTIKRPGIAPVGTMIKRCFKDRKCGFKKKTLCVALYARDVVFCTEEGAF